jgi:Zn-dependent protease with chaperone function
MTVAARALLSVVLLVGFYVLAVVQMLAGFALAGWLVTHTTAAIGAKIGVGVFLATVWAVGYGTWKAVRAAREEPPGLTLDRAAAPWLWAVVDELAAVVGTRGPDEIRLVPEVNAAVEERTRFMGLVGGRRHLYIGMPLLLAFSVAQLRSVLAHELGHYSGQHTRFAGISYRGRLALGRTIAQISPANLAGLVFRLYGSLYIRVENAVSRRQELAADRFSVRVAGREATASALRGVGVLDHAFAYYLLHHVRAGMEAGYAPDDLFGSFREMNAALGPAVAESYAREPAKLPSKWDTHPPLEARIAAIMATAEGPAAVDGGPAGVLVGDAARVGRELQSRVLDTAGRTVLPWPQFAAAAATAGLQSDVDAVLRSIGRSLGTPVPHVGAVLDHVAAGRLDAMAGPLFPGAAPAEARKLFVDRLATLLALAAVRSGAATWEHSWTGAATLVVADLDLGGIAALATDPSTVDEARHRLAARGVDLAAGEHVSRRMTVHGAEMYGGVVNVRFGDKRRDVLILDTGLLAVAPKKLWRGLAARRMARWIESGDAVAVAATHGAVFLPYEEIASARRTGRRFRWELTLHDGRHVPLRWTMTSEQVAGGRDALAKLLGD